MWDQLLDETRSGNVRSLARTISLVENEMPGYEEVMINLKQDYPSMIIGVTGPPGAGKSTLVDGMISALVAKNKRVGVLCVDPSSPFNFGALLGDRVRMSEWYEHPSVFIRSLATRGALGGLHPRIIEIAHLLREARYDYIIIETVGVGQSEVEIAGLADTTIVVLVPEAGDEIQTMKAGLMEIADVFVVNKSDRPGADQFVKNLHFLLSPGEEKAIPIIKTVASERTGIQGLIQAVEKNNKGDSDKKNLLLAEQAYHLIQNRRMRDISKTALKEKIQDLQGSGSFNLYQFVKNYS